MRKMLETEIRNSQINFNAVENEYYTLLMRIPSDEDRRLIANQFAKKDQEYRIQR